MLLDPLRSTPHYAAKSDALIISADESRRQAANRERCYEKLVEMIQVVGRKVVPGQMREGMQEKVRELREREKEGRMRTKKERGRKKEGRRKGGGSRDD